MLLGALVWIVAVCTVASLAVRRWWFPGAISEHARQWDAQFLLTIAVCGVVFAAAQFLLGWIILRFRDRGQQPVGPSDNRKLEVIWTTAAGVVFVGLAVISTSIWAGVHMESAEPGALRVEVLGKQFAWSFRYPGPDGKFGRTDVRRINDATGNPFGLVDEDPAARDDIVAATLRVPVNTPVALALRSRDVIHSFFVRELRLKQDLVPGMEIPLRFRAGKTGTYEVACSELCGLGHHQMAATVVVVSREEFDEWQKQMLEQLKQGQ